MNINPIPELAPQLKQLRLSGILDSLEARNRQAIDGKLAYTEFLALLIVGPSGVGKSHLAQAFGHCAVRQGVDVVFATCAGLTQTLNAARATGAYERKLATLARVPLLIIDDFGLKPLRAPADEDLHDLIAERYEQAAATLDRLRHNAYCLELTGRSYRDPKVPPASKTTPSSKAQNQAK